MSLAQRIRDAMRRLGGTGTAGEIAEQTEGDEADLPRLVAKQLGVGEANGWCEVDRTERPHRYLLVEPRAKQIEEGNRADPTRVVASQVAAERRKAGAAKRELHRRQARAMHSEPAPAPSLGAALSLDATAGCSVDRSRDVSAAAPPRVQHEADAPTPSPAARMAAATLAEEIDRYQTATLPRAQVLRLCALALSPDDRTPADLRDIANAIKAAA